jgi:hypothetical protein
MPDTSNHNSLAIALNIISRGYAPVPIPIGAKKPIIRDWQRLQITAAMAPQYFNGTEHNVGAIMGASSGNLVDSDLDCVEAIALARYFLPNTGAVYGRPSKRRSHHLYQCSDLATAAPAKASFKFTDENNAVICELRFGGGGKGAQSVMPGSVHTSGEHYEWDSDSASAQVTFAALKAAVTKIAVATLLVRHWPASNRHDAALRVGGLLARCGWEADAIGDFLFAVQSCANVADPTHIEGGCNAAMDAHAAYRRGENVYGLPAVAEFFGEAVAKKVAKFLGYRADPRAVFEDSQVLDAVATINENHALVLAGDKAAIMKFETKTKFRLLKVSAFKQWFANEAVMAGARAVELGETWLAHPERRQYEGIEFEPRGGRGGYYNLWQGFSCTPRARDCSKFLAHLQDNVCGGNDTIYHWTMGWWAHIYQQPEEKLDTALVLRGKMGVGKTKVGEVFGSLLGEHYALVADQRYVTGRFNAHMASLLLLHADEAFWAGDKRSEGKLKDLVSGKYHFIEFKGVDPIRVRNLIRLFVTGNQEWTVPAGFEERRFAVFDVSDAHMQDHAYFAAIDEEMNNGGREALLHQLLNIDLKKVNLRAIPKTTALFEQQVASMDEKQTWWLDTLRRGELPSVTKDGDYWVCSSSSIYNTYLHRSEQAGARRRSVETALGMFLSKMVGPNLRRTHGKVHFPPLKECRQRFAQLMHFEIDWYDPTAEWKNEAM